MDGSVPAGYRVERGMLWPAADQECAAVVFDMARDLGAAYAHCRGFSVALQAGGNCGVWPAAMAAKFGTVYCFEADPVNFRCLAANAPMENVIKFNAALGNERGLVDLARDPRNIGAHYVRGEGSIPTLRIDDLALPVCDLIYLDVEGYEAKALQGGAETIWRCQPVIVVEDKGLSEKYGTPKGYIEQWLARDFGYAVAERIHRDVILVPGR